MSIGPTGCEGVSEELAALHDGELAPEQEARVRAHLAGCSRCRARLASLERVDPWLARVPVPEVGEAELARVRARIAADGAAQAGAGARGRIAPPVRRRWLAPAFVATAAAAAALALYLALPGARAPQTPQPEPPIARAPEPQAPAPVQPAPAPQELAPPQPPRTQVAEQRPAATPPVTPAAAHPELEALSAEELAVGLELDTAEDLGVIANLELLEALVALEEGRG